MKLTKKDKEILISGGTIEDDFRPSVKSCVSEIRQSQVWCRENSTECGLEPLLTHHPGGPDGMCAGGVNAVRFAGIF